MLVLKNTVRECRSIKHINQQQLADATGTTRETINRLERGTYQSPNYRLLYDIALFFEKPIEEIFFYVEE